jgi:molybdopterin-guanine dinucleotide biosynthesis protein A
MNAIILCGGLSTRLGEIAKTIPKILLDIKGKILGVDLVISPRRVDKPPHKIIAFISRVLAH